MKVQSGKIQEFLGVIQSTKNLSDKTIIAYRSDLMDFRRFLKQEIFTRESILDYVQHLLHERKLKESTIQRKIVVLKMFSEYLYQRGDTPENYYGLQTFRLKKEKCLPKTLSTGEISKLLRFLTARSAHTATPFAAWKSVRDLALIDLLISTGIRRRGGSDLLGRYSLSGTHRPYPRERTEATARVHLLPANLEKPDGVAETANAPPYRNGQGLCQSVRWSI